MQLILFRGHFDMNIENHDFLTSRLGFLCTAQHEIDFPVLGVLMAPLGSELNRVFK